MKPQLEQLLKRCETRRDVLINNMKNNRFKNNETQSLVYRTCLSLSVKMIEDIIKDIKIIIINEKNT